MSSADAVDAITESFPQQASLAEDVSGHKTASLDKEPVNLVFIGHVDAGKSTIGGHILYLTGGVDQRTLEKYERESKELNRESWYLSWALDTNEEERKKGITVECGKGVFETAKRRFTILDAPGHKNYVPNMIQGAAQADVAVLVISARKGEFETGFEKGGQTREHAMLAKTLGVKRLIVVINKMDESTVQWSKDRYDECLNRLTPYLRVCGFNPAKEIYFMPISGQLGYGLKERIPAGVCPWYSGPSLLEYLDEMPSWERKVNEPLMIPIAEKSREMGTIVSGKIESGSVRKGQNVLVMPNKREVEVSAVYFDEDEVAKATSGDIVRLKLKGIEEEEISIGFVVCDPEKPIKTVHTFEAQLVIVEHKNIICPGYTAVMHVHTLAEEVTITSFLWQIDVKTGEKVKKHPKFVKQGQSVIAVVQCQGLICLETYKNHTQLGRFSLRDEGKTVAMGKVTKLHSLTGSSSSSASGTASSSNAPSSAAAN